MTQKLGVVTSQEPEEVYEIGEAPENAKKNRYPDIVPGKILIFFFNDK